MKENQTRQLSGASRRPRHPLLALPAILVALTAVVVLWQMRQLLCASRWVDQADRVIAQARAIELKIVTLESSIRGYALTGDPSLPERFDRTKGSLPGQFDQFRQLFADDDPQRARVDAIRTRLNQWVAFGEQVIRTKRGRRDPMPLIRMGQGSRTMGFIREDFTELVSVEEDLRDQRAHSAQNMAEVVFFLAVVAFLLLAIFMTIAHTRLKAAQARQGFLARLGEVLASTLEFNATLEQVARLAVPDWADWCVIDLLNERGEFRRAAAFHADPDLQPFADELVRSFDPKSDNPQRFVATRRSGAGFLVPDATRDWLEKRLRDPEQLELVSRLGIRSFMIVPLRARDRVLGTLTFVSARSPYDEEDLSFAEEIAERAAMAADNARLYENAQRAIRAREDTVAIVSHDLQNPINAIDLSSALILEKLATAAAIDAALRSQLSRLATNIKRSGEQAYRLIRDLLDFATIETGNFGVELKPESSRSILADVVALMQPLASDRSIRLTVSDPAPGQDGLVLCESPRVIQVLSNLVGNAIKFSPPGTTVEVGVLPYPDPDTTFFVRDEGPGIPQQIRARIFERYFQARDTRKQGTGLGLAIAKGIIEAHGGGIWVESRVGAGSTFYFTLRTASAVRRADAAAYHGAAEREQSAG